MRIDTWYLYCNIDNVLRGFLCNPILWKPDSISPIRCKCDETRSRQKAKGRCLCIKTCDITYGTMNVVCWDIDPILYYTSTPPPPVHTHTHTHTRPCPLPKHFNPSHTSHRVTRSSQTTGALYTACNAFGKTQVCNFIFCQSNVWPHNQIVP